MANNQSSMSPEREDDCSARSDDRKGVEEGDDNRAALRSVAHSHCGILLGRGPR